MSYDICLQFQLLKVKRVDEAMEYVKCAAMSFERAGLQYDIDSADDGYIILCLRSSGEIHTDAWCRDHDKMQFIMALAGSARQQQLTLAILEETPCMDTNALPGLQKNLPILKQLEKNKLFRIQLFPLHDDTIREKLLSDWVFNSRFFLSQPLIGIYEYFGPKISMYFGWLGKFNYRAAEEYLNGVPAFYNRFLVGAAFIGILSWYWQSYSKYTVMLYAILFALVNPIFVGLWKRHQVELEYKWKYKPVHEIDEECQSDFRGEWMVDPITKQKVYDYPSWKRMCVQLFISAPIMISMCSIVSLYVLSLNALSDALREIYPDCYDDNSKLQENLQYCRIIIHGPGILNALAIAILDKIYKVLAKWMTKLENYRTKREASNALVMKLMPFHLINSNASLLYLAFYVRDKARLQSRLWVLFLVSQFVDNIVEVGGPLLISTLCSYRVRKQVATPTSPRATQIKLRRIREQRWQEVYDDTFGDLKELMIQFSYVTWYAPVFPLGPVFALINNFIEIRTDSYKLLNRYGCQRPYAANTHGIEMWTRIILVISLLSVVINCSIIGVYDLKEMWPWLTSQQRLIIAVMAEHIILALRMIVEWNIPIVPSWIQSEQRVQSLNAHLEYMREIKKSNRLLNFRKYAEKLLHGSGKYKKEL